MLKGKRINLRLFKDEEECRTLLNAYNDVSQRADTDHTEIKHPQTLLKEFGENGLWGKERGILLITDKNDNILGDISFIKQSEFELEIGYRIFKKEHRRKGYVGEALPLFSAYLFDTTPVARLRIQTTPNNTGSRRVAEKSGYKQEGVLRQAYFFRGQYFDFIIYGMLREEGPKLSDFLQD